MKTSIVVHPKYNFLKEYIEQIPNQFDDLQNVLYNQRNVIKSDEVLGTKLVIKSYRRIYLPNRIRYSFFYPSKAERAYSYGLQLLSKGFTTPHPIAYIERSKFGLLTKSYFISEYTDYQPLFSVQPDHENELIKELAKYTFNLHRSGIYHIDYSSGNILFKRSQGHFEFSLIDNNRMKFGNFGYSDRLKNFLRLKLSNVQLIEIAQEYARLEKRDEMKTIERLFRYVRLHREKNSIKKLTKAKLQKVIQFWDSLKSQHVTIDKRRV
jgi:hypothetical protein